MHKETDYQILNPINSSEQQNELNSSGVSRSGTELRERSDEVKLRHNIIIIN